MAFRNQRSQQNSRAAGTGHVSGSRTRQASAGKGKDTSSSRKSRHTDGRGRSGSSGASRSAQDPAGQKARRAQKKREALQREKRQVRRDVLFTGILMSVVFACMSVYLLVFANAKAEELFENDYNQRQSILLAQNIRGKIYSADGEVLAETVTDEEGNTSRVYPYSNLFSHVVGYTYQGGSGVEQLEDYQLSQSDISLAEKAEYDAANEKYPANDVYTTLDYDLQLAAYEALGDYDGAIIVTEVNTGNILAMVSKPDFDPNTLEEEWEEVSGDSESGTLVNRASQGLYAPGSTFKIFDVVELLTEDIGNASSFSFECIGYTTIEETMINCYHWTAHGLQDLEAAFADSCNSAFVTIGYGLDRDQFNETLQSMLFGEELPYDLPSGTSSYTLDDTTQTEDVLQLAIGQGATLMTPMHLNMITAAIANGGTVYKNQIIGSVTTGTGTVLSTTETESYRTVMSEEIAACLREYMRAVVTEGTASKLSPATYNPAGKTGSAEYVDGETESHAWFTGFAPYDDPEIAITVLLEGAGSGGTAAVPVAADVMDAYFGTTTDTGSTVTYSTSSASADAGDESTPDDADTATAAGGEDDPSEGTTVTLNVDSNGDGVMDAIDTNGDGIPEAFDTDGDGIPETTYEAAMAAAAEAALSDTSAQTETADATEASEDTDAATDTGTAATDDTVTDTSEDTDVLTGTTDTAAEDTAGSDSTANTTADTSADTADTEVY